MPVDCASLGTARVRPVLEPAFPDAPEDLIEFLFADEQRVMLQADLCAAPLLIEIETHIVVRRDDKKVEERRGRRQSKHRGAQLCRLLLVMHPDSAVVERNRPSYLPTTPCPCPPDLSPAAVGVPHWLSKQTYSPRGACLAKGSGVAGGGGSTRGDVGRPTLAAAAMAATDAGAAVEPSGERP